MSAPVRAAPTRRERIAAAARALDAAGVETPALDARLLMAHATGATPEELQLEAERAPAPDAIVRFDVLVARRIAREPIAHILGEREFWSLPIGVGPEVLVPRPDSEALVGAALDALRGRNGALSLLDLGTGSGCLIAALLSELPAARGLALDRSLPALLRARHTFAALGLLPRVTMVCAHWLDAFGGSARFDLILSNPPYVRAGDIDVLAPDVARYEPRLALDGGADGLSAYRTFLPDIAAHLAPSGVLALEFGLGQERDVADLVRAAGLVPRNFVEDLSHRPRALLADRTPEKKGLE